MILLIKIMFRFLKLNQQDLSKIRLFGFRGHEIVEISVVETVSQEIEFTPFKI